MYKLKFTKLQNEIVRLLCIKSGEKINQRTIAKLLNVSPTAIAKATKLLEQEKLIRIEKSKTMNLTQIELNRNKETIEQKRIENLRLIYESKLINLLEEKFPASKIILFGSYSKGEDTIESDIDIAIEGKEKKIDLKNYEKLLERKIIINFYENINNISENLKQNVINGINL